MNYLPLSDILITRVKHYAGGEGDSESLDCCRFAWLGWNERVIVAPHALKTYLCMEDFLLLIALLLFMPLVTVSALPQFDTLTQASTVTIIAPTATGKTSLVKSFLVCNMPTQAEYCHLHQTEQIVSVVELEAYLKIE